MVTINRTTLQLVMGFALVVSLLSLPKKSEAQDVNFARLESGTNRIHMSFGLDPAVVTTVGYSRGITLGVRAALVDLDIGVAAAKTDFQDLRARVGFQTTFWQLGDWRIAGRARLIARSTSNSIYDGAGFSADLTSYVGFYRRGWFAAASIGYDRQCVMHIKHSDWYREYFYEEAVDGWYRGKAGILHGGLVTGIAAGPVEIALRLERRRVGGGESLDPPFVGGLTVSYPF
jgi:hypothetical protein